MIVYSQNVSMDALYRFSSGGDACILFANITLLTTLYIYKLCWSLIRIGMHSHTSPTTSNLEEEAFEEDRNHMGRLSKS